jgi:hypothetical protein
VIGVQDEEHVHHLHDLGIDVVRLRRNAEHHVQEVGAVAEVVLRVDERLADRLLVGEGRDGPHLGDQARDGDVDLLAVVDVERVGVVVASEHDHRRQHRHRVRAVDGSPRRSASCPRGSASDA